MDFVSGSALLYVTRSFLDTCRFLSGVISIPVQGFAFQRVPKSRIARSKGIYILRLFIHTESTAVFKKSFLMEPGLS